MLGKTHGRGLRAHVEPAGRVPMLCSATDHTRSHTGLSLESLVCGEKHTKKLVKKLVSHATSYRFEILRKSYTILRKFTRYQELISG